MDDLEQDEFSEHKEGVQLTDDDKITHPDLNEHGEDEEEDDTEILSQDGSDPACSPITEAPHHSEANQDDGTSAIEFLAYVPHAVGRYEDHATYNFAGAQWRLLTIVHEHYTSVFAAVINVPDLPQTWRACVRFRFTLVHHSNEEYSVATKEEEYEFTWVPSGYIDRGFERCFSEADINRCAIRHPRPQHMQIRCRLSTPSYLPVFPYKSKDRTGMVGLQNLGATCYLNSLLQMLFHLNSFRRAVYRIPHADEPSVISSMTLALQSTFYSLQTEDEEVSTQDLTQAFGWASYEAFLQQDVQEMMRVLLDKLEAKMKGTPVDGVVQSMFEGKVRSYIRCVNVDYESKREEAFYDIQLDVKECKNVAQSFQKYIQKEMLMGENQYEAEGYGKQDAEKGVIFLKFPPVLTIHLKRFEFDVARLGFAKIHDRYEFPLRIGLDEFIAPDSPDADKTGNNYLLHSILVHSGDVYAGHYTAYIRPSPPNNYTQWAQQTGTESESVSCTDAVSKWFKFDDETVKSASEVEAVNKNYGDSEWSFSGDLNRRISAMTSAYMLVYIRESCVADVMAPLQDGEVSQDLIDRLESEEQKKRLEEMHKYETKMFLQLPYATADHVEEFRSYTSKNDFVHSASLPRVRIPKSASNLGILRALAAELRTSPINLRLWPIIVRENHTTRIAESLDREHYASYWHNRGRRVQDKVFVERLTPSPANQSRVAEAENELTLIDDEEEKLLKKYNVPTPSWGWKRDSEVATLAPSPQTIPNPKHFKLVGAGIGMGEDDAWPKDLVKELKKLEKEYSRILTSAMTSSSTGEALVFFKIYEPDQPSNPLRFLGYQRVNLGIKPRDLFLKALKMAQLHSNMIHQAELWEELTPTQLVKMNPDDTQQLSQLENTDGDIFVIYPKPPSDDDQQEWAQIIKDPRREWSAKGLVIPPKHLANFFKFFASKYELPLAPFPNTPYDLNEKLLAAASLSSNLNSSNVDTDEDFRLKITLLHDMSYMNVLRRIAFMLNVTEPQRIRLHPMFDRVPLSPFFRGADALSEHNRSDCLFHYNSRHQQQPYSVAVQLLPFSLSLLDGKWRMLEITLVDVRLISCRTKRLQSFETALLQELNGKSVNELHRSIQLETMFNFDEPFKLDIDPTAHAQWQINKQDGDEQTQQQTIPREFVHPRSVFICVSTQEQVSTIVSQVRGRCGFRDEDEILACKDSAREENGASSFLDINSGSGDIREVDAENGSSSNHAADAGVEDAAEDFSTITQDALPQRKRFRTMRSPTPVALCSEIRDDDEQQSTYGLLLFTVVKGHIQHLLPSIQTAESIGFSWMEIMEPSSRSVRVCAQLVTQVDFCFMARKAPVKSMTVKVIFFTMLGQQVRCLPKSDPFVTYVREDDTHDSLLARIARITGDAPDVMHKYRMAVVRDNIPFFLTAENTRSNHRTSTHTQPTEADSAGETPRKKLRPELGLGLGLGLDDNTDGINTNHHSDADASEKTENNTRTHGNTHTHTHTHIHTGDPEGVRSVWNYFEHRYPTMAVRQSMSLSISEFPILGLQKPSGSLLGPGPGSGQQTHTSEDSSLRRRYPIGIHIR